MMALNTDDSFQSETKQGGAVEARWAHNPKVGGSKPPLATIAFMATIA
jgi:hypothetical protein